MPVELRIETDGKTEIRRVDVTGTDSTYSVETFGRPRRITIDPQTGCSNPHPTSPSGRRPARPATRRAGRSHRRARRVSEGPRHQQEPARSPPTASARSSSSSATTSPPPTASATRSAATAIPRWTEVWSHIELGRIFDVTGQRERAVNEYRSPSRPTTTPREPSTKLAT